MGDNMIDVNKQDALKLINSYRTALIELMPKELVSKVFAPVIAEMKRKPQTYKNEVLPILSYIVSHTRDTEEIYNTALTIGVFYLSDNCVPISSRRLKEKDLSTIINYIETI